MITESQNQADPAREIIRFFVMCHARAPLLLAAGFLEFLRFVSALFTGIGAFGGCGGPFILRPAPIHNTKLARHTPLFWG